jgi:phage gpG-like protein
MGKFKTQVGDSVVQGDFSRLDALVKGLSKSMYVDIGVLSGEGRASAGEGEITIAGIGAVHEFGSLNKNIPQRSFVAMPLQTKAQDIETAVGKKIESLISENNIEGIYELIGIYGEAVIQEAFETGGFGTWAELKESTIERKGSSAILIDTGRLRQAITSKVGGK